ncbi:MAG: multidrug efflux MFS transporter [Chloroflexi bacterium]|nr:multidrug efflux MFS transporter [Chloroflexota bacterium]
MSNRRIDYKWRVGIVFVFGNFMQLLDVTIVNVALPTFGKVFEADATQIEWVVTGYLLSLAVFIPVSGWAGDRFGMKRVFMLALALFTVGSLLCGLAWNIESLSVFRVLQGAGGGIMTPVGITMLFRAFPPEERARASSLLLIPSVLAPACGPLVGGALVQYLSWRWIFFVNLPFGVLGLLAAAKFLREERQPNPGRLDVPGLVLGGSGLAMAVYALSQAGSHGFGNRRVAILGLVGLLLLGMFAIAELRARQPMIDLRLLGNRLFRSANLVVMPISGGLNGTLFLFPIFLQSARGLDAFQSGLTTFPQAVGVVIGAPIVGHIYGRVGPRRLIFAGVTGLALLSAALVAVSLTASLWWVRLILFCMGLSGSMTMTPAQTAAFATIKREDQGRATAIFAAGRQVGGSIGVAIVATVLMNRLMHYGAALGDPGTADSAMKAVHVAFIAGAGVFALALLALIGIRDSEAMAFERASTAVPAASEL